MQCSCVHNTVNTSLSLQVRETVQLYCCLLIKWLSSREEIDPAHFETTYVPLLCIYRQSMIHISVDQDRPSFHANSHTRTLFPQENIFTIPNLLSVSRIALSPVLGYLVLVENYILALGLFSLAGISDLVSHLRRVWRPAGAMYLQLPLKLSVKFEDKLRLSD